MACSIHPLPEDVSPIPTEAIVGAARCELRLGLLYMVNVWFADASPQRPELKDMDPETVGEPKNLKKLTTWYPDEDWDLYMDIAIAYDWTFDITETNTADAGVGFGLPMSNPAGTLTASAGGSIVASRQGKRTFKNQDKLGALLTKRWRGICNDDPRIRSVDAFPNTRAPGEPFTIRDPNPLYPISGSVGLGQAVVSFLKVAAQEGGLDTFTDELTFTTTVNGKAGAGLTLTPVPNQFRLVSASAGIEGNRVDLHKVKFSFAFPRSRPPQKDQIIGKFYKDRDVRNLPKDSDVKNLRKDGEADGWHLNQLWRAAYALCVVDARSRENDFRILRLEPPEVTCIKSTNAFFPRGDGKETFLETGRRIKRVEEEERILELPMRKENQMQQENKGKNVR